MESFFSQLRMELIYAENYKSIEEAKTSVFEYVEIFYNRRSCHSAIGYISPVEYSSIILDQNGLHIGFQKFRIERIPRIWKL